MLKWVPPVALVSCASYHLWQWYSDEPSKITPAICEDHQLFDECAGVLKLLPYNYDPAVFDQEDTIAVYLVLQGSLLEVYEAKEKIPFKELFDDPRLQLNFTRLQVYNISGCNVRLLPLRLDRVFHWEHHYPIEIILKDGSLIENTAFEGVTKEGRSNLVLFARSDRDKAAWARRLISATQESKIPLRTQDPVMFISKGNPYKVPPLYIYRRTQGVWLNSLFSRILTDEKTKELMLVSLTLQVQELLNNLTYGDKMETLLRLTVSAIDLNNFGTPRIAGVAAPYENDLGLWEEINLKYNGLLKIIVEVRLNPKTFGEDDVNRPSIQNYEDCAWVYRLGVVSNFPCMANIFERTRFYIEINLDLLSGGVALNIPKEPTDTAWLGFRHDTRLDLSGTFYWGTWKMPFLYKIIDVINARLVASFQRNFMIPNMLQMHLPMWTRT